MTSYCILSSIVLFGIITASLIYMFSKRLVKFKSNSVLHVIENTQEYKMAILVRKDIEMSKGKIAAQCCHACLGAYQAALKKGHSQALKAWEAQGQPKITLSVRDEQEMLELQNAARSHSLISVDIRDAGHTQVAPGTRTTLAIGPGPSTLINHICGHLKLY